MNLTLHLTEECNMACSYCPNHKSRAVMTEEIADAAVDLAFSKGTRAGLCFFGGEPLLCRDLIYRCLDRCEKLSKETGKRIDYRMTTNGTLLDEEFIIRAKNAGMIIGVSFEGTAQSVCRRFRDGSDTLPVLNEKTALLLKHMPLSYAMMTIAPEAVDKYAESVKYIYEHGFRRVTATIAFGPNVCWTEEKLAVLKEQLLEIADFYTEIVGSGKRFYFSTFDAKISECISGYNPAERCHLGYRQMPVNVDGRIYPCTQFIGDPDYLLGDVFSGINTDKQIEIAKRSSTPSECLECELRGRCTNSCGCMNRLETGNENKISPLQCTYERMIIDIADSIADKLMNEHEKEFVEKFSANVKQ